MREFVERTAEELGMTIRWQGKGADEKGYDAAGKCVVAIDRHYFRPAEVDTLLGDATKAKQKLGWTPKVRFRELVAEMAQADLREAERTRLVRQHGYKAFDQHE
jgi:GDPmannose 4,6-dehydratase